MKETAHTAHSVLFIGKSATHEDLKRLVGNVQNITHSHAEISAVADMKIPHAEVIIVEHAGNPENTCTILEEISARYPDTVLLLHAGEKPAPDKIVRYMQSGARDIFGNTDTPENILRRAITFVERRKSSQKGDAVRAGRTVVFFSSKGGVGKTYLTIVLARLLGQAAEYNTLVIDLDLQFGDADLYLNANSTQTIAEMIDDVRNNSDRLTDFILDNHIHKITPNLHILSAPLSPERADLITAQDVSNLINTLKKRYSFILVDTNTVLNDVTLTAFDKADRLFIMIDNEIASAKNAGQTMQLLKKANYSEDKIDFIINRFDKNHPLSDDLLLKTLTRLPYARISVSDKVGESINQGYDLVEKFPADPFVVGARELLGKLAKEWEITFEDIKVAKPKAGFLSWILKP